MKVAQIFIFFQGYAISQRPPLLVTPKLFLCYAAGTKICTIMIVRQSMQDIQPLTKLIKIDKKTRLVEAPPSKWKSQFMNPRTPYFKRRCVNCNV